MSISAVNSMGNSRAALRLWDMNPDTSKVRSIIRNKLVEILWRHPKYCLLEHEAMENFARCIDEMLYAEQSQLHYMNLETLEGRLNDLILRHENTEILPCDVFFSSHSSMARHFDMPDNMQLSSAYTSYHNVSDSIKQCAGVPSVTAVNNNSACRLMLDGDSTASLRYMPNGHHRVVANASIAPYGDLRDNPERLMQAFPMVSNNYADYSSTVMPPNYKHVGYWNNEEFFNDGRSFSTNNDQTITGAALYEQSDNHLMSDYKLSSSGSLIMDSSSFGSSGDIRHVHHLGTRTYLSMGTVNAPPPGSPGKFLQYLKEERFEQSGEPFYPPNELYPYSQQKPLCATNKKSSLNQSSILNRFCRAKGSVSRNQPYNQSDKLQLEQKELYIQQQHLSVAHKRSEQLQPRTSLHGHNQDKNCTTPNQVPMEPLTVANMTQQFHPSIVGSKRKSYFPSESSAGVGRFRMPKLKNYSPIHRLYLTYSHASRCSAHDRECGYPNCSVMKLHLHHIFHCSGCTTERYCSNYKKYLGHFLECRDSTCGACVPVKMSLENNMQGTFSAPPTTINIMYPEQSPPSKRTKTENPLLIHDNENSKVSMPVKDQECQEFSALENTLHASMELDKGPSPSLSEQCYTSFCEFKFGDLVDNRMNPNVEFPPSSGVIDAQPEKDNMQVIVDANEEKLETNCMTTATSNVHVMDVKMVIESSPDLELIDAQPGTESMQVLVKEVEDKLETNSLATINQHEVDANNMKYHLESSPNSELTNNQHEEDNVQVSVKADEAKMDTNCITTASSYVPLMDAKIKLHLESSPNSELIDAQHEEDNVLVEADEPEPETNSMVTVTPDVLVMDTKIDYHLESSPKPELVDAQHGEDNVQVSAEADEAKLEMNCISNATSDVHVMDVRTKLHLESSPNLEQIDAQPEKGKAQVIVEGAKVKPCVSTAISEVHLIEKETRKLKMGVSLIDSLPPEAIRQHIVSTRHSVGQTKEKLGEQHTTDVNTCSICWKKALRYNPPVQYCAACRKRINPNAVYYYMKSTENGRDLQTFFCRNCFCSSRGKIKLGDGFISKFDLVKGANYALSEDLLEWWVNCDKCKAWQHQVCSLFNPIRNKAVQADHTCANCILQEIESGERTSLLQSTVPGAKDLPTTMLSNHIEEWVFRRLKEERQERANSSGKDFSEVPTADGLVVRVVSSVDKQLEVKKVFRDIFQNEAYPAEFPYKSKAIVLFQNIDGADVFLYVIYVQEYTSRCPEPNKRRAFLSYLDSVKHFKPDVATVAGQALRSFVYHEILIAYLDYCKKRGFISCNIWACAPKKLDDYILYSHPKTQKIPKTDKLCEWYQKIFGKAEKLNIVVEQTNLYDQYIENTGERKTKITAACLPYFDGDYWPGIAEVFLQSPDQNKTVAGRVLRGAHDRGDSLVENRKDVLLMHHLRCSIGPSKGDFMMILLQHACKHCSRPILSGHRWACSVCKNFQLCDKCFQLDQNREVKDSHPINKNEKHSFNKVQMEDIPEETIDEDLTIKNDIFDTRLAFLSYCENNHYQFDSLRRAKHSTMMILYHLHNPNSHDLELAQSVTVTDHSSQQSKKDQLLQALSGTPLLHASKCAASQCKYQYCRKLKGLFRHATKCEIRANGGCECCRKIWFILHLHAQSCIEPDCQVPRCKELKHFRKKQLPTNSHR